MNVLRRLKIGFRLQYDVLCTPKNDFGNLAEMANIGER